MSASHFLAALAATAGPLDDAAPARWDLSATVCGVSDYRFRGVSLSGRSAAPQGSLDLEHASGLRAGVWASTVSETAGGADVEVDLSAGYGVELAGGVSLDATVLYYLYPGDGAAGYGEAIASLSAPVGPATPSLGIAYAPAQSALRDAHGAKDDNLYLFGGLELPVGPVSLDGALGYERGPLDYSDAGGKWDWRVGGTVEWGPATIGLAYHGSDVRVPGARGRDLAGDAAVLSLEFGF